MDNKGDLKKIFSKTVTIPVWAIILVDVVFLFLLIMVGQNDSCKTSTNNQNSGSNVSETNKNNTTDNSSESNNQNTNTDTNKDNTDNSIIPPTTNKNKTLGDTITFDGLEMTFDTTYTFTKVDNNYSDHNGKSVIRLGVTVKNVSSEKNRLNMFYYDFFGANGTTLDSVAAYFDDTVNYAGDLKPGASYKKYFYILYDGDGKYSIDFDNHDETVSVEFDVVK